MISTIASSGTVVVKLQGSDLLAASPDDYTDLLGTAVNYGDSDDDKVAVIEIDSPSFRYVRIAVVTATANGTIDGGVCVQHKGGSQPVTHDTTVVSAEYHLSPGAGTA
jgi:hypothetical protein